jgi:hypothetical protein
MKRALLFSALSIVLFSSCSTAFKAGQTPDDVYYSPGVDRPEAKEFVSRDEEAQYQQYVTYLDDRYLRMKVANRYRWGAIDNFDYWNDSRYDFNTYSSYNYYNTVNPYNWNPGWNLSLGYGYGNLYPGYNNWGWNSPIYTVVHYSTPSYGSTSGSNISAYRNKSYNNTNYGYRDPKTGTFIPSGNNNSFGSLMKRVFTPATSTENASSYDRPVRTYTPSTTTPSTAPATSSSAGGSSGGYGSTGSSSSSGRAGRGN